MLRAFGAVLAVPATIMIAGAALGPVPPPLSPTAHAGKLAFNDTGLSGSGKLSCATCHDPDHAFAPPNALAVQRGGAQDDTFGTRAVPSLTYARFTPKFHFDAKGTPVGGFDRDGRADTLAAQAAGPLLSPREMANPSVNAVAAHLRQASYAAEFRDAFGAQVFADDTRAFAALGVALEAFQRESQDFAPFSSKYDDYLAGKTNLTGAEARGLALFNNKEKGNCAACHPSSAASGVPPLFTDFSYDNAGVPRNRELPSTANISAFDLGLCGPDRVDLAGRKDLCGQFKVPSLRNVATRHAFFHNGRFHALQEAVRFYATRDTNPKAWYPARKFDDLPADLTKTVNLAEVPYDRKPGQAPRLSEAEVEDIVAFLRTLTDDARPR